MGILRSVFGENLGKFGDVLKGLYSMNVESRRQCGMWVNAPAMSSARDGFLRHIDAAQVDKQVLDFLMGQVDQHRDLAVSGMMDLMGKDDIFTKAAVESSIDNIDQAVGQAIPEQSRQWLGMMGFRVIINDQGQVVDIEMPAGEIEEGDEY